MDTPSTGAVRVGALILLGGGQVTMFACAVIGAAMCRPNGSSRLRAGPAPTSGSRHFRRGQQPEKVNKTLISWYGNNIRTKRGIQYASPGIAEEVVYKKIMVPVDLEHIAHLEKSLSVAADLASHYQTPVCYVSITTETPSSIAHTPSEFGKKLEEFGRSQAAKYGHQVTTKAYATHDPAIDLNDQLLVAVNEIGADLVVMASHIPGIADHIWPSHGGKIASHSSASVFLVR